MAKHVKMPCGWGCGEELTASTVRSHFTLCPNRGLATRVILHRSLDPDAAGRAELEKQGSSSSRAAPTPEPRTTMNFGANLGTHDPDPTPNGIDRMAGLRNLLHTTEARVGVKGPRNQTPEESAERARRAAIIGVEVDVPENPYQKSENKRAWADKMAKLRQLGTYDDAGAQDGFNELIRGHQLPQGFMRWSEARKIDWLVENVELDGK